MGAMELAGLKPDRLSGVLVSAMGVEGCAALFQDARPVVYRPGQAIFSAGEPGQTMILLQTGRVEISITALTGRKSVLAHMGPGEVLGEIAALDGGPRSADAVAATDVSGRLLSRENALAFVAARPDLARAVIAALCQKVRNASEMFRTQSVIEGEPRLARGLLRLFDQWGVASPDGTMRLAERFSQQDIGEFTGLARENVNRQIKALVAAGLLRRDAHHLVLLDRDALSALADA